MATLWTEADGSFVPRAIDVSDKPLSIASNQAAWHLVTTAARAGQAIYVAVAVDRQPLVVNGVAAVGGLRVLRHQDEIVVGTERAYFSAEGTPVVEAFRHGGEAPVPRCPICRGEIHDGIPVVRCPGCGRLHHQITANDERPAKLCWTYLPACRFCQHPTSLSGEPTWRPDPEVIS